MDDFKRGILVTAMLYGFAGVAFSAFAAHALQNGLLQTAAYFLLFHAAVLIAAVLLLQSGLISLRAGRLGTSILAVGAGLFSIALILRVLLDAPFIGAFAPIGGIALLVGWFVLAYAAFAPAR